MYTYTVGMYSHGKAFVVYDMSMQVFPTALDLNDRLENRKVIKRKQLNQKRLLLEKHFAFDLPAAISSYGIMTGWLQSF